MRKLHQLIILLILPIFFITLVKSENNPSIVLSGDHQYVLSVKTCNTFFRCKPEEAEQSLNAYGWTVGRFQSAVEDENGNLVLTLSDSDVEYWKNYIDEEIKDRYRLNALDGCLFIVTDSYHKIEAQTKRELYMADGFNISYISLYCGIMQMLNGENPNEWYVDIEMIDVESGKTVKTGRVPSTFTVTDEDWDKALVESE